MAVGMCCLAAALDGNFQLMAISAATVAANRPAQTAIKTLAKGRLNIHLRYKH